MDQLTTEQYIMIGGCIAALVYLLICGAWGAMIADEKHRSLSQGFWLGALFGPLGLVVIACMPTNLPAIGEPEVDVADLADRLTKAPVTRRYTDQEWAARNPKGGPRPLIN